MAEPLTLEGDNRRVRVRCFHIQQALWRDPAQASRAFLWGSTPQGHDYWRQARARAMQDGAWAREPALILQATLARYGYAATPVAPQEIDP